MKLTVAGTGSNGNCYVLTDGSHRLLLDCGVKWREALNACEFNVESIDGCLFTHWHKDHMQNIDSLHLASIPTYGCDELSEFVGIVYGESVHGLPQKLMTKINGGWTVVPWYVPHTGAENEEVPCYAYSIISPSGHRTVYMTDFLCSPMTFKSLKVHTMLIACNHDDEIEKYQNSAKYRHIVSGHSSLSVTNEIIRINQTEHLRNVILCHLSAENATPEVMREVVQKTVGDSVKLNIARKGMEIDLEGK